MTEALDRLAAVLQQAPAKLADMTDEDAARRREGGGWSSKEVLGHLIDSAANNHQRFVRAQAEPRLEFPRYEQGSWVAAQAYQTARWPDLVNLWLLCNRHLLHVARAIPRDRWGHTIAVGGGDPMTLQALVEDYVLHLEHHLGQIGRA